MTTIAPPKPGTSIAFPKAAVEASLREELSQSVDFEASMRGITLPANPAAVATFAIDIDSLTCVDILCAVESVLGFELREGIVRAGGYRSIDGALAHMMPGIEREWMKKKGSKP